MPRAKRLKSPPRRGVEWRRDLMLDDFGPRSFARSIRASLGRTMTPWNSLTAKLFF